MDLSKQLADDVPVCRICHCTESPNSSLVKLISPCNCSGSLKYVHHSCLQQWLDTTNSQRCELCKQPFSMSVKYKPLHQWSSLNASPTERRRLICNCVFNLVSMVCIFWSIYVLIERAAQDARNGTIDWSFYVKISVVTIGLIIGVIFLFVQLKLYYSIFVKWKQSNRIIIIRNANSSNRHSSATNTEQLQQQQQQRQQLEQHNQQATPQQPEAKCDTTTTTPVITAAAIGYPPQICNQAGSVVVAIDA